MKVIVDGEVIFDRMKPRSICTGYVADSIEMQAGDFESLMNLAQSDRIVFEATMRQLEARFKENRVPDHNRQSFPPFLL